MELVQMLLDSLLHVAEMLKLTFSQKKPSLFIETLEGIHEAKVGDYIIKGIQGETYPCKPDIFESTYEKKEM
jgi:hypothetical protein